MQLRNQGVGYGTIAAQLGLLGSTVKTFCRRNHLQTKQIKNCIHCGNDIELKPQRANRKFCSDDCRRSWWKSHDYLKQRSTFYSITCECCGKTFESYGNDKRKYCDHACYINARYYRKGDAEI